APAEPEQPCEGTTKKVRPRCRGRTKDSPSRLRFRPPRPTGLPPRGCPLFVEPLGRGFDLLALRARCKGETTVPSRRVQGGCVKKISKIADSLFARERDD